MYIEPIDPSVNEITAKIVDAAYQVHSNLGPGLLEAVYQKCMIIELTNSALHVQKEVNVPLLYKGQDIDAHLRIDLLVENNVIVEIKSVDHLLPVHEAQLLSYLKLYNKRVSLLINFNVPIIKRGIKRFVL
jgi:GxxExxY protein